MENLTNPNLYLILGVKEGCHFDRVQKPTVVLATLNGQCLETKIIQQNCNPQYATDLTWETDKSALRRMRCNSTPIKVECYAVNDTGSREKLGYILLSVRSAQIIQQGEDFKTKMNWHTVLGLRSEFNNCKPQLMLYLIIKERDIKIAEISSKNKDLQDAAYINLNMTPKWLQDEHLIQLGPFDTCQDIFFLHVTAVSLTNLGEFIRELKDSCTNDFNLIFNLFDMFFKLKSFKIESDSVYLNQKVVIKLRSSVNILANYLSSKSHFLIKLKKSNITVAHSEINLQSLLNSTNFHNIKQIDKNTSSAIEYLCILKNMPSMESRGDHDKDKFQEFPSLKISVKLLYMEPKDITIDKNDTFESHYSEAVTKCDDIFMISNNQYNSKIQTQYLSGNNKAPSITSSVRSVQYKENSNGIHKSYCLNIILKSITFSSSKPDVKKIEFRFYNPKGEVVTKKSVDVSIEAEQGIKLENVKCDLHFISTSEKIEELLSTFAPKINISDSTLEDKKCLAQILFDVKKLFEQQKLECQYIEMLTDCNSKNEIGFIEIFANLEDCTVTLDDKIQKETLEVVFNDDLAYKMVDELETWKERQKEMFREKLQKKEESHMTLLNEEWQRRRQFLESKLACGIQQCKTLADNLGKATEDLKKRKIQSLERETKLLQANEESQWKYERKLRQLQEALEKMQTEFSIKLRTLEERNQNLLLQIDQLNSKNYELEKIKMEQDEQLKKYKKNSLADDQTSPVLKQLKILEEKLDSAQKGQKYFREQWDNAVGEIQNLKMQNQRALQTRIKSSKEELHNLDLEEILHADSEALTYDQIVLNEIQRELDVIRPESNRRFVKSRLKDKLFTPQTDLYLSLDHNSAELDSPLETNDKKLRMLIEKRDALLKTGDYTIKDDVIIELNSDIRSLLMNS